MCFHGCLIVQNQDDKSISEHLSGTINIWVNKKEEFTTQKIVSEICESLKNENKDLYFRLMEKCALKGISIGEGIFKH